MIQIQAKKAFTLIELLIVIAIIAILAAILFPVFGRARENARRSSCQSNMKQIGLGIMQYVQDYDEKYPSAYWYKNDVDGTGAGKGYVHVSAMINPYVKSTQVWVCPSDKNGGVEPTNPPNSDLNLIQTPSLSPVVTPDGMDKQVPKLSYIFNSAVLPRKRKSTDVPNTVSMSAIDDTADTIMAVDMADSPNCLNGSSVASGDAIKSHRSANAVATDTAGTTAYKGEHTTGESNATVPAQVYPVSIAKAIQVVDSCEASPDGNAPHISYIGGKDHFDGANYAFADGHVKFQKQAQTLNPNNFLWGKKMYGTNTPVLKPDGTPVG